MGVCMLRAGIEVQRSAASSVTLVPVLRRILNLYVVFCQIYSFMLIIYLWYGMAVSRLTPTFIHFLLNLVS